MTREEAIKVLSDIDKAWRNFSKEEYVALEMAIKALEQEPCNTDTCKVVKAYMNEWDKPITVEPKTDVLDKIKSEIAEYKDDKIIHAERNDMIDIVLEIIDKHIEGVSE